MKTILAAFLLVIMAGCQTKNQDSLSVTPADAKPVLKVVASYEDRDKEGKYQLSIQLIDEKSGRPVETGLNTELKDPDGFFKIAEINC